MHNDKESSEGDLICSPTGRELKCGPDGWIETGYLCNKDQTRDDGDLMMRVEGDSIITLKVPRNTSETLPFRIWGVAGSDTVFQQKVREKIVSIMPISLNLPAGGQVRFTGIGTDILFITVNPGGIVGHRYEGTATCCVVYP
jgi:hypothetical protein